MAAGLAALLAAAPGAAAPQTVDSDPEANIVSELVVVAPAKGPAWWKASKGDSVVWILGLPPKTPIGFHWDQSTLKRRLKGARLMLAPYVERSGFGVGVNPPGLTPQLGLRVRQMNIRLGGKGIDPPATAEDAVHLRGLYYDSERLSYGTLEEVTDIARRRGVPVVTPPVYTHVWQAGTLAPERPETTRCIEGIFAEVTTPPQLYRQAAKFWAKGDVQSMLAVTPKGMGHACDQLWPGHWDRTIAFQTSLIAQALEKPGKVVASAHIVQLVAKDGILERLRAQGYTIADPSKPLEE